MRESTKELRVTQLCPIFICETCNKEYANREAALKCEASHTEEVHVKIHMEIKLYGHKEPFNFVCERKVMRDMMANLQSDFYAKCEDCFDDLYFEEGV